MSLVPISAVNVYAGVSKQTSQGVGVAPSNFFRLKDGSTFDFEMKAEDIAEGDTSRRLSLIIKNQQKVKFKTVTDARPILAGVIEDAALGASSDTFTNATVSTTLTSSPTIAIGATASTTLNGSIAAGATSLTVNANTGLTGTGKIPVLLDQGTIIAEVVTLTQAASGSTFTITATKFAHANSATVQSTAAINLTANTGLTGSGTAYLCVSQGVTAEEFVSVLTPSVSASTPYAFYVLSNNGALVNSTHASGDAVKSNASHVMTDQTVGSYFTWEWSIGGTAGYIIRVVDCQLDTLKRSAQKGSTLVYEAEWSGIASTVQASTSVVTYEAHNPFLYTYSKGGWTIDGSTSSVDALNMESFNIDQKNALDVDIQGEGLTLDALLFGNIRIDMAWKAPFTSRAKMAQVYLGGTSGTTDQQLLGTGSATAVFTEPDNFNTLTYSLPNLSYTKFGGPQFKADGKHMTQDISASCTSNQGAAAYLIQTTITNSKYSQY